MVGQEEITLAYTRFDGMTQSFKDGSIDDFCSQQPGYLFLAKLADDCLTDMEAEVFVQLSTILWLAFTEKYGKLSSVPRKKLKSFVLKNGWMKTYIESDLHPDETTTRALKNYKEVECLKFVLSAINGRWSEAVESENSAQVLFYFLKSLVDSLSWASRQERR